MRTIVAFDDSILINYSQFPSPARPVPRFPFPPFQRPHFPVVSVRRLTLIGIVAEGFLSGCNWGSCVRWLLSATVWDIYAGDCVGEMSGIGRICRLLTN